LGIKQFTYFVLFSKRPGVIGWHDKLDFIRQVWLYFQPRAAGIRQRSQCEMELAFTKLLEGLDLPDHLTGETDMGVRAVK